MSSLRILLVVQGLELFEALCLGIVGISGKGDKSRTRESITSENVKNTYLLVICHLSHSFALNNPGPDFDVLEVSEWQEISQIRSNKQDK